MVDRRNCREMQVSKALCSGLGNAKSSFPRQTSSILQVIQEGAIGDVLVNEQRLLELDAAAEQTNKALVIDLTEDADFVEDLVSAFGVA